MLNSSIGVHGGTISTTATWKNEQAYHVLSPFTVADGVVLTLEAGSVLKYHPGNNYTKIQGTLGAIGTVSEPIVFTSWYDDSIEAGGDVNDAAGSDIAWRVRSPTAATAIAAIIADPLLELAETNRYFRSLEYHDPAIRTAALRPLLDLAAGYAATRARNDAIIVR